MFGCTPTAIASKQTAEKVLGGSLDVKNNLPPSFVPYI